jgi:hypothetical protein
VKVVAIDGLGAFSAELGHDGFTDVVTLDTVLVRCTNPACRTFQMVRVPADPSTELPCKRCSCRVGAFASEDLREVDWPMPEYGQVSIILAPDGESYAIAYRDFETGIFGLVNGAGRWTGHPFSRWVYDDPEIRPVRFTGRRVCPLCLMHCGGGPHA